MLPTDDTNSKKSGYTYWKRDIQDAHVLPDNKPQPVDGKESSDAPARAPSGSKWNSAGTYEEKDVSTKACKLFEEILCEDCLILLGQAEGQTKLQASSATVTGTAQNLNVRGTPRLGFEFKITLTWKGSFEGEEVKGELTIDDLDSSMMDDFEIRPKTSGSTDNSKKAAEAMKKGARAAIKAAADDLSKRMLAGGK
mmetsp:Transcript_29761/g.68530  ORF Transcript_29761/g.68530 Transcript_29761/m.68530 type:complete len:196 (-) Transcript_29761:73-660(-)